MGLPFAGKSTLFTALTHRGSLAGRSNQAVVEVLDPRLEVLAHIAGSRRIVSAKVRFVDAPGGTTARAIGEYRQTDALCLVLDAFSPEADPSGDLATLRTELLLADLASIESGRAGARKRAKGSGEGRAELAVLEAAHDALSAERLLRDVELEDGAHRLLRGYGPLTLKPWIVVANVGEGGWRGDSQPEGALAISAALEAEVAAMEAEEAAELLAGFGLSEPGVDRVIAACYAALDIVTFFTAREDEARAWQVPSGATAPQAAGVIHSDMERGFIRAEVVSYDDLVAAGSWEEARAAGRVRTEGKGYVVREGDVLNMRFAV